MPRARKHTVEFGNFHCTAGTGPDTMMLVDVAEEVVLPAMLGAEKRAYGSAEFFFLNQSLVKLPGHRHGIVVEFVKNTDLLREQVFEGGRLKPDVHTMESAPSAIVLLVLETHRLIMYPKTTFAPGVGAFEATCNKLFAVQRQKVLNARYKAGQGTRKALAEQLPPVVVHISPLGSEKSVRNALKALKTIISLRFDLLPTNATIDGEDGIRKIRESAKRLNAREASIIQTSKDGLKRTEVVKQLAAANKVGTSVVTAKGKTANDVPLTIQNDELKIRIPIAEVSHVPTEAAPVLSDSFDGAVADGLVAAPKPEAGVAAKIQAIYTRLAG